MFVILLLPSPLLLWSFDRESGQCTDTHHLQPASESDVGHVWSVSSPLGVRVNVATCWTPARAGGPVLELVVDGERDHPRLSQAIL